MGFMKKPELSVNTLRFISPSYSGTEGKTEESYEPVADHWQEKRWVGFNSNSLILPFVLCVLLLCEPSSALPHTVCSHFQIWDWLMSYKRSINLSWKLFCKKYPLQISKSSNLTCIYSLCCVLLHSSLFVQTDTTDTGFMETYWSVVYGTANVSICMRIQFSSAMRWVFTQCPPVQSSKIPTACHLIHMTSESFSPIRNKRLLRGGSSFVGVSLYYWRVFTFQYKAPWGIYCSDLEQYK